VKTYGDFENLVLNKIEGTETEDCSSQQTFYKLEKFLLKNLTFLLKK
jgi:hypothetical protein